MTGRPPLMQQVRDLLDAAVRGYTGTPGEPRLRAVRDRLDEPLRVAVAGKVKAGKSTLLNALVGEEVAPTDAGECTTIVTWYSDGPTYRATLHDRGGTSRQVPLQRGDGGLHVDLGPTPAAEVERLVVEWPSASLRTTTLIDTPGIDSLSSDVSRRTTEFLVPGKDEETPADAVIYLMRQMHHNDIRFLEAFHDEEVSQATPVNAIGVLSRADEVAGGRLDAMTSATRIATRYRSDPRVRRLCQTVIPVAGLLAQSGSTLREAEFRALEVLARAPLEGVDALLLSASRFAEAPSPLLDPAEREQLLARLGLFGVRLAVDLIAGGVVASAPQLATELVARSGLRELQQVLATQFAARRDVLKSRSALLAVEAVLVDLPLPASGRLAGEFERVSAGAHEFVELRLLNGLRRGGVGLPAPEMEEIERLLGGSGSSFPARLGLPAGADGHDLGRELASVIARWQRRAESPMSNRQVADAARVVVRTCEGLHAALA
ncbi:MAG: hypothetical protein QOD57_3236 [Actinomycetota bacterium]|nr:hypothetical protein [Actinomycetota bacterium]